MPEPRQMMMLDHMVVSDPDEFHRLMFDAKISLREAIQRAIESGVIVYRSEVGNA